jgi:hypothetical protein
MKQSTEKRTKGATMRMSEAEHLELERLSREAGCQKLSHYARKMLLSKPLVQRYENQSLEEFANQMIELRRTLEGIASDFQQVILRLYCLPQDPDVQQAIIQNEQDHARILREIETISQTSVQIYRLWSRE